MKKMILASLLMVSLQSFAQITGGSDIGSHTIDLRNDTEFVIVKASISQSGCSEIPMTTGVQYNRKTNAFDVTLVNEEAKTSRQTVRDVQNYLTNFQKKLSPEVNRQLPNLAEKIGQLMLDPVSVCLAFITSSDELIIPVAEYRMSGKVTFNFDRFIDVEITQAKSVK